MSETTGGEVIARMLQTEGVEKVFGIIDGTYFGFYAALHRLGIEIITSRHETCAAHMAGTYARLTGRLGVCIASNGPGVANLLPGLVVEPADGNRVPELVCKALRRRYEGRPGVVHVDVPENIMNGKVKAAVGMWAPRTSTATPTPSHPWQRRWRAACWTYPRRWPSPCRTSSSTARCSTMPMWR